MCCVNQCRNIINIAHAIKKTLFLCLLIAGSAVVAFIATKLLYSLYYNLFKEVQFSGHGTGFTSNFGIYSSCTSSHQYLDIVVLYDENTHGGSINQLKKFILLITMKPAMCFAVCLLYVKHLPITVYNNDDTISQKLGSETSLSTKETKTDGTSSSTLTSLIEGEPDEEKNESPETKRELYRISTFQNLPKRVHINASNYASAGFYYTGEDDVVECFACSNVVRQLTPEMDPFNLSMHRTTCKFARNTDSCGNIRFETSSNALNIARPSQSQMPYSSSEVSSSNSESFGFRNSSPSISSAGMISSQSANLSLPNPTYPSVAPPLYNTVTSGSRTSEPSVPPPPIYDYPLTRLLANIINPAHETLVRSLDLCREQERLQTFANWPTANAPDPTEMAASGWFYLGNLDRTQCFSCGGVLRNWRRSDNPRMEHLSHFAHCPMVQGRETMNVPASNAPRRSQNLVTTITEEEKRDLRIMFPCEYPATPNMSRAEVRISTFSAWLYTRATPQMFAEAGLFSLGVRDRVKCFYCGGGLQNFHRNDLPMVEHAKWYPTCEYVLQQKGPAFVHSIVAQFPDLNRPVLPARGLDVAPTSHASMQDPQPQESAIDRAMRCETTQAVIGIGYEEHLVRFVQQERIRDNGKPYESASELLDAVAAMEKRNNMETEPEPEDISLTQFLSSSPSHSKNVDGNVNISLPGTSMASIQPSTMKVAEPKITAEEIKRTLEELHDSRLCKVCLDRQADVVFIPCGHICCCMECTRALRQCPVCRIKIEKAVRTYTQ